MNKSPMERSIVITFPVHEWDDATSHCLRIMMLAILKVHDDESAYRLH
jgi:hypothetical protein